MIMSVKQREIKIEPRTKLNHSIYINTVHYILTSYNLCSNEVTLWLALTHGQTLDGKIRRSLGGVVISACIVLFPQTRNFAQFCLF